MREKSNDLDYSEVVKLLEVKELKHAKQIPERDWLISSFTFNHFKTSASC
jgi:hypothetical protein